MAASVPATVEGVTTRVMSAEHLVAIALRTGRSKDHIRILQFIEQDAVDQGKLQSVLERHGLTAKWEEFKRKYLEGIHGYRKCASGSPRSVFLRRSGFWKDSVTAT